MFSDCVGCLCLFGLASYITLSAVFGILPWFCNIIYRLVFGKRRDVTTFGKWAVITGSTDGIGKGFALTLAARGMNLFLISRSDKRLEETRQEIKSTGYEGQVETLAVDFSDINMDYNAIDIAIKDRDIGLLINNVGVSYPSAQYLTELSGDFVDKLINVNLRSAIRMCQLVIPGMTKKGNGCIVCIGSGASQLPSEPLYAVYVGVKGGLQVFCRSLQVELKPSNIIVQCHVPLLITTKLSKIRTPSLTVPTVKKYVASAMYAIENNSECTSTVCPYSIHRMTLYLFNHILPGCIWDKLRYPMTQQIRQKYLQKLQRKVD